MIPEYFTNKVIFLSSVGINTGLPNVELTIVGDVSANGSFYGDGSKLTGIISGDTEATNIVRNTSANWDSVYSSVLNISSDWDSVYSSVKNTSANWDSVYSNVFNTSSTYVKTIETNTSSVSAVKNIVVVSALPLVQSPNTLYILV